VLALQIIEHFDIIENILPSFVTRLIDLAADPFSFEQIEEAFDNSVIMAITAPPYRMLKIVSLQE